MASTESDGFITHQIPFNPDKPTDKRFISQSDCIYLSCSEDCIIDFNNTVTKEGENGGFWLRKTSGKESFDVQSNWMSVIGKEKSGILYIGLLRK